MYTTVQQITLTTYILHNETMKRNCSQSNFGHCASLGDLVIKRSLVTDSHLSQYHYYYQHAIPRCCSSQQEHWFRAQLLPCSWLLPQQLVSTVPKKHRKQSFPMILSCTDVTWWWWCWTMFYLSQWLIQGTTANQTRWKYIAFRFNNETYTMIHNSCL